MGEALNRPVLEVIHECEKHIAAGGVVYQRWHCKGCNKPVLSNNPNMITMAGRHEECGHVTDFLAIGCGYLVITDGSNR